MDNAIDFEISFRTLLYIAGVIVALGGATAVLARWVGPFKAFKEKVEDKADKSELEELRSTVKKLRTEIDRLKGYQDEDHGRLKTVEAGNEKICKCVLALIDHELTGNSVDKLRNAKDEMQNYLIER